MDGYKSVCIAGAQPSWKTCLCLSEKNPERESIKIAVLGSCIFPRLQIGLTAKQAEAFLSRSSVASAASSRASPPPAPFLSLSLQSQGVSPVVLQGNLWGLPQRILQARWTPRCEHQTGWDFRKWQCPVNDTCARAASTSLALFQSKRNW